MAGFPLKVSGGAIVDGLTSRLRYGALALLACSCALRPPAPQAQATATLRLGVSCEPPGALEVSLTFPADGTPVLCLEDSVYGDPGMAQLITDVEASDGSGPLPLTRGPGPSIQLTTTRPATGAVTVRYRARSVPVSERGSRFGLRHDDTGIGGLGAFFLLLPDSSRHYPLKTEWARLSCTSSPAQGFSSFGFGPQQRTTVGPLSDLRMASYFIGTPTVASVDDGPVHLRAAWFGAPALDPAVATAWAAKAFAAERRFFADEDDAPYHLFLRVLPDMGARSNGMGQPSSFLSAIGPQTTWGPTLRRNIAHEMLHRWLGLRLRLGGPEGSGFWFTEGFTVHYASLLLFRAGLIPPEELLAELNTIADRHRANPRAAATNEDIQRGFFSDDALSTLPYTRGALYAAELNAALLRASGGARSLDDLLRALYRASLTAPRGESGLRELPAEAFRDAVLRELGPAGAARFDAVILQGAALPEPPPDAYGPCFERRGGPWRLREGAACR